MPAKPTRLPDTQSDLLAQLGEHLRNARLRRRWAAGAVASAAGITRVTLHRAESGAPAITVATLIRIMGVLGLADDLALLARDDKAGRQLQGQRPLPARRAGRSTPGVARRPLRRIRIDDFPQLRQIAWHLSPSTPELAPQEAFALYERNWRHVDHAAMGPEELALLNELTATVGKGVLLV